MFHSFSHPDTALDVLSAAWEGGFITISTELLSVDVRAAVMVEALGDVVCDLEIIVPVSYTVDVLTDVVVVALSSAVFGVIFDIVSGTGIGVILPDTNASFLTTVIFILEFVTTKS